MSDCILWTGATTGYGYGSRTVNGPSVSAHRYAYEQAHGPIPEGYEVDHICHNADVSCPGGSACGHRRCVNPDHLEAVTHKANILRSTKTLAGINARKTHCKRGHEFTPDNTYVWEQSGGRVARACKTCHLARAKARADAKRDASAARVRASVLGLAS